MLTFMTIFDLKQIQDKLLIYPHNSTLKHSGMGHFYGYKEWDIFIKFGTFMYWAQFKDCGKKIWK